jgi:hypothetical protein
MSKKRNRVNWGGDVQVLVVSFLRNSGVDINVKVRCGEYRLVKLN